jgi:hypothetical protein
MPAISEVVPDYVGADNILLTLAAPPGTVLQSGSAILVNVSLLNEALTSGLVCPLELNVQAPSGARSSYLYTKKPPTSFAFTPHEGGTHLVLLAESGHNRWRGSLLVVVIGQPLDT